MALADCVGNPPAPGTPIGGQGQSARCSRIFYVPCQCPTSPGGGGGQGIKLDGTPPWGKGGLAPDSNWFQEQVIRIEINSMVASRDYGHDKSFGSQDTCKGLASWNGRINTRIQCINPIYTFHAGDTVWLQIYPLGVTNGGFGQGLKTPQICGYAEITEDPIVMNLEQADPIEHNYTFKSKGWWNMPVGVSGTFDCCQCLADLCQGGMNAIRDMEAMEGSVFSDEAILGQRLTKNPVTVYQWDGTLWHVQYDECEGGFMPGPMPTDTGKFVGEMKFVPCAAAA